jgi:hypothetical protein
MEHSQPSTFNPGFTQDFELVATAMHGNCVFPDAEKPVDIQHLSGQAVTSGPPGREGKIHFPLGLMVDVGAVSVGANSVYKPGLWLQVDCDQVELKKKDVGQLLSCTEVVGAEVFIGCNCVWSKEFSASKLDPPKTRTFREMIGFQNLLQACKADGPKGLEVTLTLRFGQDGMRFCSVAVFDVGPLQKWPRQPETL